MAVKHKTWTGAIVKADGLGNRQIRVIASTPARDRVKDIMDAAGCDVSEYLQNPIVLASHDPKMPIGTAEPEVFSDRVEALITFAPAGISAKADEYCGLAKAGILNTVSIGFEGIEMEPLKGGGIYYKKWMLMELSLVAVPANKDARVIERSLSETKEANWKVAASRNIPVGKASGDKADDIAVRILTQAGFDGDEPDSAWARKGFLLYDAANPESKESYLCPFVDVVDGRFVATAESLKAAVSALNKLDIPEDAKTKALAVITDYEGKMAKTVVTGKTITKEAKPIKIKGLYDVAQLAQLLASLGYVEDNAEWEAEYEGDNSPVPAMLYGAMQQLGAALIAMTQEEVSELLAEEVDEAAVTKGMLPALIFAVKAAKTPFAKMLCIAGTKAGRAFSTANEKAIRTHCKSLMDTCDTIKSLNDDMLAMLDPEEDESGDNTSKNSESGTDKALVVSLDQRQRDADMLRLKAAP